MKNTPFLTFPSAVSKCINLYLTKFSERESESIKMCCINIYLIGNPFTFNKYFTCKLLYMIVSHYQSKTLYNKVFFIRKFMYQYLLRTEKPSKTL